MQRYAQHPPCRLSSRRLAVGEYGGQPSRLRLFLRQAIVAEDVLGDEVFHIGGEGAAIELGDLFALLHDLLVHRDAGLVFGCECHR